MTSGKEPKRKIGIGKISTDTQLRKRMHRNETENTKKFEELNKKTEKETEQEESIESEE